MEPRSKKVIRGAHVEGVSFFNPKEKIISDTSKDDKAQAQVKMKEMLHQKKEISREFAEDLEKTWEKGELKGYQRGLLEGRKQGYEVGKEEGLEIGFQQGTEKMRADLKHLVQLMNSIAVELALKQEGTFDQLKPEIIKFSLAVCEHILRRTLSDPKIFIDLIERLLAEAKSIVREATVTVALSPNDLATLDQDLKLIIYDKEEIKKLNFISDKSIEQGNCRIETSVGLINFDIKRILAGLEKKVLEVDVSTD